MCAAAQRMVVFLTHRITLLMWLCQRRGSRLLRLLLYNKKKRKLCKGQCSLQRTDKSAYDKIRRWAYRCKSLILCPEMTARYVLEITVCIIHLWIPETGDRPSADWMRCASYFTLSFVRISRLYRSMVLLFHSADRGVYNLPLTASVSRRVFPTNRC